MSKRLTLVYWIEDSWYVGYVKEFPNVRGQGASLEELEENMRDVCRTLTAEEGLARPVGQIREIEIEV